MLRNPLLYSLTLERCGLVATPGYVNLKKRSIHRDWKRPSRVPFKAGECAFLAQTQDVETHSCDFLLRALTG
jgi:hypothetical protein